MLRSGTHHSGRKDILDGNNHILEMSCILCKYFFIAKKESSRQRALMLFIALNDP